jgi:hypothetical protein
MRSISIVLDILSKPALTYKYRMLSPTSTDKQSVNAGRDKRVRLRFLEFIDDYLYKIAPKICMGNILLVEILNQKNKLSCND